MDELTLIQPKTIRQFPVVLFGRDFYQPMMDFLLMMAKAGTISSDDLQLILLTDDVEEAMHHIQGSPQKQYCYETPKRRWWLLEK